MKRLEYQGWTILISPEYSFTCFPPNGEALISKAPCCCLEMAEAKAKSFIDKMLVREQIGNLLDDWLEESTIEQFQYSQIERLIADLVNCCASNHLQSAQKLPPLQPENPPDS